MGQKTNPNILRLGKTTTWTSKYLEKKSNETASYSFKNLEIKKFVHKFFKDYGLIVNNCKLQYSDNNSLQIFVSYYLALKSNFLISNKLINQFATSYKKKKKSIKKVRLKKKKKPIKKVIALYPSFLKIVKYRRLHYNKILNKIRTKENYTDIKYIKKIINIKKRIPYKDSITYFEKNTITNLKQINKIITNFFIENFFESIKLFINKNLKICLIVKQLNKDLKKTLTLKKTKQLKRNLVKLRRFEENTFFEEGINTIFLVTTQNKSINLLSKFIATQLKQLKRHNFFLRFLKKILIIFKNKPFSKIESLRIKIKGRINGRRRARHRIIQIGKGIPVLTLNNIIHYSEETAFTSNGTIGVKIWMLEKN